MTDTMTMLEKVARSLMDVTARLPGDKLDREVPVLAADPDFDDLPNDHTEGNDDDDITQEAVLCLARAALESLLDPTPEMVEAMMMGYLNAPREAREEFSDRMSIAIYRAAITAALNTGENPSDANPKSR